MANGNEWASTLLAKVAKGHPAVSRVVSEQMEKLLNAGMSERELTEKEIRILAKKLIIDMVPAAPTGEAQG